MRLADLTFPTNDVEALARLLPRLWGQDGTLLTVINRSVFPRSAPSFSLRQTALIRTGVSHLQHPTAQNSRPRNKHMQSTEIIDPIDLYYTCFVRAIRSLKWR